MLSEELRNIAVWVRSRRRYTARYTAEQVRANLMLASALDDLAEQAEMLECTRVPRAEEVAERIALEAYRP